MIAGPFAVVARIVKTHGLKGEVSVVPAAETSFSLLTGLSVWFVPPASSLSTSSVVTVRQGPKGDLATFSGVDSIHTASTLVGREVLARTSDLPQEWMAATEPTADEIGYTVTDPRHGALGQVVEIIETGANDVWVVEGPFGEVLIPVIDDVVDVIDHDARTIVVRLLAGLLPGEGEEA